MNTADPSERRGLAIVGDGSATPGRTASDPSEVLAALKSDARLLHDHSSIAAFPVAVAVRDAGQLSSALRPLLSETTAIFLARTNPGRARIAQQDLACTSTTPVITEQDTAGMALTAALLVTLHRRGVAPQSSRVVVTGTTVLPLLVPLLMAAGVGDIASWNETDALAYPLAAVARDATVVIDLIGAATRLRRAFDADVPVLVPDPVGHLLAVPGLFRALHAKPTTRFGADPLYRLDVHRACAHALATLTPIDRVLPDLADPDLTDVVARGAAQALRSPYEGHRAAGHEQGE